MATKKKASAKKAGAKKGGAKSSRKARALNLQPTIKPSAVVAAAETPSEFSQIPEQVQAFLRQTPVLRAPSAKPLGLTDLRKRVTEINARPTVS
ncbi:MAG TPA: hypothetical protein VD968_01755, partial [Pyrinomonadaceae bacterium]|nr:hypothetical protein [Pyrinomonadaceae bacterium]